MPAEGFEPPTYGLQNRCTTTVLSRHTASTGRIRSSPDSGVKIQRYCLMPPPIKRACSPVGESGRARGLVRPVRYVDPQHCWVLAAPRLVVAPCVPALLRVKVAQLESCVCGDLSGVAVIVKLFAVGAMVTV